jgi:hypothetical protein
MKTPREIIAGALDEIGHDYEELPPSEVVGGILLSALAAEGFSIVETGRDPYLWLLEADDDALICRSGTKSITVRAKHATVFDIASVEPPKRVLVRSLSRSTREGKTE